MHTDPNPYVALLAALKGDEGMPLVDAVKAFGHELLTDALNDDVVLVDYDFVWSCNVVKGA